MFEKSRKEETGAQHFVAKCWALPGRLPGRRVSNWPGVLAREMAPALNRPLCWGEHDCCLFVARVAGALTGRDIEGRFRGRYRNALEALRYLRRSGTRTVEEMVEMVCREEGFGEISPWRAGRGDVLLYRDCVARVSLGGVLGICLGRLGAIPGEGGLVFKLTREATRAWEVGGEMGDLRE